jgi:hypothetical protein
MFFILRVLISFIQYIGYVLYAFVFRIYVFIPYIWMLLKNTIDTQVEFYHFVYIKRILLRVNLHPILHKKQIFEYNYNHLNKVTLEDLLITFSDSFSFFIYNLTLILFILIGYLFVFNLFFSPSYFFLSRVVNLQNLLFIVLMILIVFFFLEYVIMPLIILKSFISYYTNIGFTKLQIIELTPIEFINLMNDSIKLQFNELIQSIFINTFYLSINLWCVLFLNYEFDYSLLYNYISILVKFRDFFILFYRMQILPSTITLDIFNFNNFIVILVFLGIIIFDRYMNKIVFYKYVNYLRNYYNNLLFREFLLKITFCILNEYEYNDLDFFNDSNNNFIIGENVKTFFEYKLIFINKFILPHIYIYITICYIMKIIYIIFIEPIKFFTFKLLYYWIKR